MNTNQNWWKRNEIWIKPAQIILFPIVIYLFLLLGPRLSGDAPSANTWSPFDPIVVLMVVTLTLLLGGLLFERKWVNPLLIVLILLALAGFIGSQIDTQSSKNGSQLFSLRQLVLLITLAGAFGGLMYGMRGGTWAWPKTDKGITQVGYIRHLLIGVAGGWIIFIILPGDFELDSNSKQIEFIRLIGLAFLGGFGGYALVEKVLERTLKDLEDRMDNKEQQEKEEAQTLELINQYLDNKTSNAANYKDNLENRVRTASLKTRLEVLRKVQEARQKNWVDLIGKRMDQLAIVSEQEKKQELIGQLEKGEQAYREFVDKLVPILETLSGSEEAGEYHRIFGQLGFTQKDKSNEDYNLAVQSLSKAIAIRDKKGEQAGEMYEFNRAICLVMAGKGDDPSVAKDLKTFAQKSEGKKVLSKILDYKVDESYQNLRTAKQDKTLFEWLENNINVKTELSAMLKN